VVEEEVEVTPPTEDVVRREVGKLLRVDYRGQMICVSCLVTFLRNSLGITYTKGQIERTLRVVSHSPGALTYKRSFVCDQCGKKMPCLGGK
jgi:hypothetical protein